MPAYLTRIDPAPMPADESWLAPALDACGAGQATAVVVTRPLGTGPAVVVAVHDQLPAAGGSAEPCPRASVLRGRATGPARFATVVEFDGPRTAEWVAAEARASHERIHPATEDVPGYVGTLRVERADGGVLLVSMAESAEALQEGMDRILSTELLPGEDPAMLTGPDRTSFSVVVRADLPVLAGGVRP